MNYLRIYNGENEGKLSEFHVGENDTSISFH